MFDVGPMKHMRHGDYMSRSATLPGGQGQFALAGGSAGGDGHNRDFFQRGQAAHARGGFVPIQTGHVDVH